MQRGEKRAMKYDDTSGASVGPAAKKPNKEKIPDFDWGTDNYALTKTLVNELRKPENRSVLFPDSDGMIVKTGDTKEDVYRRIAKVVHPEAFASDSQTAGSRMKNKTVALWKEYSGYCRRLQELATIHRITIPPSGPDTNAPADVQTEWRKMTISMPVFTELREFMPIRPEERPKAPGIKAQPPRTPSTFNHTQGHVEDPPDHIKEINTSSSFSGPVSSPSVTLTPVVRELVGDTEGHKVNGVKINTQKSITLNEYLELRRSFQEDVRLGIFSPAEAKARIEILEQRRQQHEQETESHSPSRDIPAPLSSISSIGYGVPSPIDQNPDPVQERVFEEKTILLNFRKPVIHHSIMDKSFKEIFRAILTHAMECSFAECRLDSGRKKPQICIVKLPANEGSQQYEVYLACTSGYVPLTAHPNASCSYINGSASIYIMDIPLMVHESAQGWAMTCLDYAHSVAIAANRRQLTLEEIRDIQMKASKVVLDQYAKQQLQYLNESSTFLDILQLGVLCENTWKIGLPFGKLPHQINGIKERTSPNGIHGIH